MVKGRITVEFRCLSVAAKDGFKVVAVDPTLIVLICVTALLSSWVFDRFIDIVVLADGSAKVIACDVLEFVLSSKLLELPPTLTLDLRITEFEDLVVSVIVNFGSFGDDVVDAGSMVVDILNDDPGTDKIDVSSLSVPKFARMVLLAEI